MAVTPQQVGSFSMYAGLAGMATQAIGSFYSAKSQKSSLKFQAAMAEINARSAERSAQSVMLRGQREVGNLTLKAGQLKSTQRASMAANGIDIGEGSAAELQASTDLMKEIDVMTIQDNATREAWAHRTQGVNAQNEGVMARSAAGSISPFGSAAGSLLGSAGSVASSWYALNKLGALNGTPFEMKG
jgi:hypothetical protein